MEKRKANLRGRGMLVIIYGFLAFMPWMAFNNYPNNILASAYEGMYGWNAALVSTCYSLGAILAVLFQLVASKKFAKANAKKVSMIFGIITLIIGLGIALIKHQPTFLIFYVLLRVFGDTWTQQENGMIIGQWFPRLKGTVMGIVTISIPLCNALVAVFGSVFGKTGSAFIAFSPFFIIGIIALLILGFGLSNYPGEKGCFPDNDRSMTPEVVKAMQDKIGREKATSVWDLKGCLRSRDFWLIIIPQGLLMFGAIGFMVQIVPVLLSLDPAFYAQYGSLVMLMIAGCACLGSYLLGVLDTKKSTKFSIMLACIFMIVAGALGAVGTVKTVMVAAMFLGAFMGAGSNYAVSSAASYWKSQDFTSVTAIAFPVVNLIAAPGAAVISIIAGVAGYNISFGIVGIFGVIAVICIALFNPKHLTKRDAQYREKAGLPMED